MLIENHSIKLLNTETFNRFKNLSENIHYDFTTELFYEGQTPIVAYLIVSGSIQLQKNKKVKKTLGPKTIVGVKELMLHEKIPFSAKVLANSKICFLSKSDILEILETQDDLSDKLSQLIAI